MAKLALSAAGSAPGWLRIGLGFGLVYLLALLLLVPANLVLGRLQPQLAGLGLPDGLPVAEGTLWHGRFPAAEALFGLRRLDWRFAPAALLQGRIGVDLVLGQQTVAGRAGLDTAGALHLDAVRVDGRVSELLSSINGIPLLSDARLNGLLSGFVWGAEGCLALERGQLLIDDWRGFAAERLNQLQGVQATLSCSDGGLQVAIAVGQQALQLTGGLSLAASGAYRLQLSAQPQTADLREMLLDLGFARQGGTLVLRRQGRLR